jgi:endonuclease/exonuclease/phosphatase (EEP) superfamily protein YafD
MALLAGAALAFPVQWLAPYWWLADIVAQFAVQTIIVLAPAVLLAAVLRWWHVALMLAVPLAFNLWLTSGYWSASGRTAGRAPDAPPLRILSLNVLGDNPHFAQVLELIRETDADVVALQEVNSRWIDELSPLNSLYPHRHFEPHPGNFGIGLWSKTAWEDLDVQWFGHYELPTLHVRFRSSGDRLFEFVTTHPMPPTGRERSAMRNAQLLTLASSLDPTAPRIVAGDFNLTPWSPWFREFLRRGGLVDAGLGYGMKPSWHAFPTWLGGVRIDHVLVSPGWIVDNHQIGPDVGSDHRAVIVDLRASPDH